MLHLIDELSEWVAKIVDKFLLAIMAILFIEVLLRRFFGSPTIWAHEVVQYTFLAYGLLGGGYALLYKVHVNMNIIHDRLSQRAQAILDLITSVFFFAFCIALIWHGTQFFIHSIISNAHSFTTFGPPLWPKRLILPVAAVLILLQGLAKFIRDFRVALKGVD